MNVYDKAVELLELNGWTQGQYIDSDGKMCMLGALFKAKETFPTSWSSIYDDFSNLGLLSHWNDAPERTATEVISTLKKASKLSKDHL